MKVIAGKGTLAALSLSLLLLLIGFFLLHRDAPSGDAAAERGLNRPPEVTTPPSAAEIGGRRRAVNGPPDSEQGRERELEDPPGLADQGEKRHGAAAVPEEDEAIEFINEALQAPDSADRAHAFREIGLLDPTPSLIQVCLRGLSDPHPDVRVEAILALEMFEDSSVTPFLERTRVRDPSAEVRLAAREALENIRKP